MSYIVKVCFIGRVADSKSIKIKIYQHFFFHPFRVMIDGLIS